MKIKRFIAPSMRDAIRLVREEQGAEAVILSSRRVEGGVEVIAATDYDAALVQTASLRAEAAAAQQPRQAVQTAELQFEMPAPEPVEVQSQVPSQVSPTPRLKPSLVVPTPRNKPAASTAATSATDPSYVRYLLRDEATDAVRNTPPRQGPEPMATRDTRPAPVQAPVEASRGTIEIESIRDEMQSMRRFMEQQLGGMAWNDLKTRNPVRADVVRSLTGIGLELKLAREIATELPDATTQERARFLPMGLLARRIPAFKHEWLDVGGARNDVVALVGPTGVGKTTTIAKLAARYVQNWGLRDVALITTDHYRIGAQEQLFTYGRLLGVPVLTADNQHELRLALDKLRACKLVLIDTAGMSPRDANLEKQFATLSGMSTPVRTALVMSAGSQGPDIDDQFKRFAPAGPSAVILTKLDEASRVGPALSAVIRHGLPLAYVTDGQRVPEDLSAARPEQLVLRAMQLSRKSADPSNDDEISLQFAGAAAHA